MGGRTRSPAEFKALVALDALRGSRRIPSSQAARSDDRAASPSRPLSTPYCQDQRRDGGPLMMRSDSGAVMLALFEGERAPLCRSTVAFKVDASAFQAWRSHLQQKLPTSPRLADHIAALSLYFDDPDGNPFEITCYDTAARD